MTPPAMRAIHRLIDRPVNWKWQLATGLAAGIPFHLGFPQVWVYTVLFTALSIMLAGGYAATRARTAELHCHVFREAVGYARAHPQAARAQAAGAGQ